jgi:hypothetical protein
MFTSAPWFAHMGSKPLFVLAICIILSMYGGGFATVPAYLADMFGTQFVGAIHGRLLTAWSTAGIGGPVVVSYIHDAEIAAGVSRDAVYDVTLYVLACFLAVGLLCNWAIKPVRSKWFMSNEQVEALQPRQAISAPMGSQGIGAWRLDATSLLAWLAVGVPILWGVWVTLQSAFVLFG